MGKSFKECSCKTKWEDREDFLSDKDVEIIGYQVDFDKLENGFFLFNHMACKNTLGILTGDLAGLYKGPVYEERRTGREECPGYCLKKDNLKACPAKCACAYLRNVIQIIKEHPKK